MIIISTKSKIFNQTLILTDSFVQIGRTKIPWNQIIHFDYKYGIRRIPPPKGLEILTYFTPKEEFDIYSEYIGVRGYLNGQFYSFTYTSDEDKVGISLIDHSDYKHIKKQIQSVVKKSDEDAINFRPSNFNRLFQLTSYCLLGGLNFAGYLFHMKFKNHSEIAIDSIYPEIVFGVSLAVLIYICLKNFISFKKFNGEEKYYKFFLHFGISLVLCFLSYFSIESMIFGNKYSTATEYKVADFYIENFMIEKRKDHKNRFFEVLVLDLKSNQVPFFPIHLELNGKCKLKIHHKDVLKIKVYKTLDNQLFYKAVNNNDFECRVTDIRS